MECQVTAAVSRRACVIVVSLLLPVIVLAQQRTSSSDNAGQVSYCVEDKYGVCGDPYEGKGSPPHQRKIASCTTISSPGNYELTGNIGGDAAATCILIDYHVQPLNLDLGGYTITGAIFDRSNGDGNTIYNGTITCNRDTTAYPQACLNFYSQSEVTTAQWRAHHLVINQLNEVGKHIQMEQDRPAAYKGHGSGLGMACRVDHIWWTSIPGTGSNSSFRYGSINSQGYCNTEMDHNYVHCTNGATLSNCQGLGGTAPYMYLHDNDVVLDYSSFGDTARGLMCDYGNNNSGGGVGGTCDMYNNLITATNNRAIRYRSTSTNPQSGNVYNNTIYNIQTTGRLAAIHIGENDVSLQLNNLNIYDNSFELNRGGNGIVVGAATGVTIHDNKVTCYQGTCVSVGYFAHTDAWDYAHNGTSMTVTNTNLPSGLSTPAVELCGPVGNPLYGCTDSPTQTTSATVCNSGTAVGNGKKLCQ